MSDNKSTPSKLKDKLAPVKRSWLIQGVTRLGSKPRTGLTDLPDDLTPVGETAPGPTSVIGAIRGDGEGISRARVTVFGKKIGTSSDKGYHDGVDKPVDEFLKSIGDFDEGPGPDGKKKVLPDDKWKKGLELYKLLAKQRDGYEDRKGNEKSLTKLQQRGDKVNAIDGRLAGLQGLLKLRLEDTKELVDRLMDQNVTEVDGSIQNIFGAKLDDVSFMDALFDRAVESQLHSELTDQSTGKKLTGQPMTNARNALFRGNNAASKLIGQRLLATEDGKAYGKACTQTVVTVVGIATGELEFKPSSLKDPKLDYRSEDLTPEIQEEYDKRVNHVAKMAVAVFDAVLQTPPPAQIRAAATSIAAKMRAVGIDDRDEIAKAVGAFVMLRLIVPRLTEAVGELKGDQKKAAVYISKAIQNVANGVLKIDVKDAWTQPVLDAVAKRYDDLNVWLIGLVDTSAPDGQGESSSSGT